LSPDAVVAFLARGVERHDDFVSDGEFGHRVALLVDLADEFVAADEVGWAFEVTSVEVEVGALYVVKVVVSGWCAIVVFHSLRFDAHTELSTRLSTQHRLASELLAKVDLRRRPDDVQISRKPQDKFRDRQ
jgi:hypothetical protein